MIFRTPSTPNQSPASSKRLIKTNMQSPEASPKQPVVSVRRLASNCDQNQSPAKTPTKKGDMKHDEWCAVCDDGGDMILCDTCPKIFHLACHVPALKRPPRFHFHTAF